MPDSFDQVFTDLGIDPTWAQGGAGGGFAPPGGGLTVAPQAPPPSAPQQGQWAPNNQGFLDWATKNFGADKNGFVNLPKGGAQFQDVLKQYTTQTGNQANFQGGPSGDRVDFGQGTQDALTSSGQIWNNENPGAGGSGAPTMGGDNFNYRSGGGYGGFSNNTGGGGSLGSMGMPQAPTVTDLKAPDPFTYQANQQGAFQSPAATPGYNPMQAPDSQQAQQVGAPASLNYQNLSAPERLTYNPMQTPGQFSGDRHQSPSALSYQNLATPENFQYQDYKGPTAEEFAADPGVAYRQKAQQDAVEGSAASKGVLRTGNTAIELMKKSGELASQEYGNVFNRGFATNQANNQGRLGAAQTNAQTGLAYGQANNQNALNFGQQNIQNAFNANESNYGRASNEAQQGFANQFAVNQANNQGQMAATSGNNQSAFNVGQANNAGTMAATQGNVSNALNATQANNQANLAYGGQNFQQGFATNQANNQGALAAQNQQFNQAATGYGINQGAQQQNYNQALGAYGMNAQTGLGYGSQNQQNQLATYNAQTNAALGLGNLNLGYQQAQNSYNLGQGNLGLGYGNLALNQQGQEFNQGLQTYNTNYQTQVLDPWNMNYQLANMGNPGAPNSQQYANNQSDLITGAGNANAASQIAGGNAGAGAAQSLGNMGADAALNYRPNQPSVQPAYTTYAPGSGQPLWR